MMLTEFEERLSSVPRWSIVRTIQKQTVDQHLFRVAVSAPRIAVQYGFLEFDDYEQLYELQRYALLHDWDEALSSDISSPAKRYFDSRKFSEAIGSKAGEQLNPTVAVKRVVKVADYYEALVFLYVERSLGNASVLDIIHDVSTNLLAACADQRIYAELLAEAASYARRQQDPLR